jgi:hypothetical protein
MNHVIPMPSINSRRAIALLASTTLAMAACTGSANPSPSPTAAAVLDACLVGTWTVVGQSQNSPANDEQLTYSGGAGEVFTIDAQGGLTIDTHAAQPVAFKDPSGEGFTAVVAGTGHGTVSTAPSGTRQVLYFKPSADDTRTTHSFDAAGVELGPARPDTAFSAVYTCAPGRFTFYKTAVNYMVDGPIVELVSGTPPSAPSANPSSPASPAASTPTAS